MTNKKIYIYVLINPLDNGIFYVGYAQNIKKRFGEHLRTKGRREKNLYKDNVVNKILKSGLKPEMKVIDECDYIFNAELNIFEHEILEIQYIKKYKDDGIKSISEAGRYLNISSNSIVTNLKGITKKCNGYIWKYKNN